MQTFEQFLEVFKNSKNKYLSNGVEVSSSEMWNKILPKLIRSSFPNASYKVTANDVIEVQVPGRIISFTLGTIESSAVRGPVSIEIDIFQRIGDFSKTPNPSSKDDWGAQSIQKNLQDGTMQMMQSLSEFISKISQYKVEIMFTFGGSPGEEGVGDDRRWSFIKKVLSNSGFRQDVSSFSPTNKYGSEELEDIEGNSDWYNTWRN